MNARRLRTRVQLVATLGAATLVASFGCAPAGLQVSSQGSGSGQSLTLATTIDPEPDTVSLSIDRYGPDIVRQGQALVVSASVATSALSDVTGVDLVIRITTDPIEDRALLAPWQEGTVNLDTREVARTPAGGVVGIPAANSTPVVAVATPEALDFPLGGWGVYGVSITLERSGEIVKEVHTFTTWLDDGPPPVPVSVIVLASGSTERVDALLTTAMEPGVSFAVDPTVLSPEAEARLAGSGAYILSKGNLDVASLARAGASDVLDLALDQTRQETPETLTSAPWLAPATDIDRATVDLASSRGAAAVLALPSLSTTPPELSGYSGDVPPCIATRSDAQPGDPILLFADSGLSLALSGALAGNPTAPARVVAETALLAKDDTAANPVLVVVGSSWSVESNHQSATLSALLDSPWVKITSLPDVISTTEPAVVTLETTSPSPRDIPVAMVTQAGSALRGIEALAAATEDPHALSFALEDALLRVLSVDYQSDPEARDAAITTKIADIDAVRASVSVPSSSSINLISASGNLPVTVENDLDVDVTVTVVVESRSPILRIQGRPEVTVVANSSLQVLIPVRAISSGNVVISVGLTNHENARITPATRVRMRIHAQWGNAFTIGIASLGALLLLAGTFRTVRRGRADTRLGPLPFPDDEGK